MNVASASVCLLLALALYEIENMYQVSIVL